jgi:hypothetical protein
LVERLGVELNGSLLLPMTVMEKLVREMEVVEEKREAFVLKD